MCSIIIALRYLQLPHIWSFSKASLLEDSTSGFNSQSFWGKLPKVLKCLLFTFEATLFLSCTDLKLRSGVIYTEVKRVFSYSYFCCSCCDKGTSGIPRIIFDPVFHDVSLILISNLSCHVTDIHMQIKDTCV